MRRYRLICDGSAAAALDGKTFVVANDEHDALLFYRHGKKDPFSSADMEDFLGLGRESDIEAAARIKDRIYWISSHGQNNDGKGRKRRSRFFATEIKGKRSAPRLKRVGEAYKDLLDELVCAENLRRYNLARAARLPSEAKGGLNIEGLAAWNDGELLIGFRSPVRDGKALAVPFTNPGKVIKGKKAKFGDAIELDLGGRGIRSIERVGEEYVIIAGSPGKGGGFAIYRWSGQTDERPKQVENIPLGDLRPEAIFAVPGSDVVYLLSDDSGFKKGRKDCKDRKESKRSFRAVEIAL